MTPEQQLEFLRSATEQEILEYLAMRVRAERYRSGLSQSAFAAKASIPLRTYKRFELSGAGSIETLVRIFIAMEHARGFFTLFPAPKPANHPPLLAHVVAMGVRARKSTPK